MLIWSDQNSCSSHTVQFQLTSRLECYPCSGQDGSVSHLATCNSPLRGLGAPGDLVVVMTGIKVPAEGVEGIGHISIGVVMTGIEAPAEGVEGTVHISIGVVMTGIEAPAEGGEGTVHLFVGVVMTGIEAPAEGVDGTVHIFVGPPWPGNRGHACG